MGAINCHILLAKSRVAPLKRLTLPRLELQGAIIAVRMKETIVNLQNKLLEEHGESGMLNLFLLAHSHPHAQNEDFL